MVFFAYGFGASIFLAMAVMAVVVVKRSFRAGFRVYED